MRTTLYKMTVSPKIVAFKAQLFAVIKKEEMLFADALFGK
jgi:hypothetical protein